MARFASQHLNTFWTVAIALLLATTFVGFMLGNPAARAQQSEDQVSDIRMVHIGRISGVQFAEAPSVNEGMDGTSLQPDWILSGRWIAVAKSQGDEMTIAFHSTIDMLRPDGTAKHQHLVNNFQQSEFSQSEDMSITMVEGTATVTMTDGPVANVPISFRAYGENLVEIRIGPERVNGHFGASPIYGVVTSSVTTNLETGESQSVRQPQPQTQPAALPSTAVGPAIPEKGYLVEEIASNLYWITDGTYNTMFLVGDSGVAAVDAPPSLGERYLQGIAEVTDKQVEYVIYSHSHLDHIGAANMFPDGATYIAQEDVVMELQRAHDLAANSTLASQLPPVPTASFSESYVLDLADGPGSDPSQVLQLDYFGSNHEEGNIFIYAPEQKTLMLVDVVFPGWVPFLDLALASDVVGFVEAHDVVLGYDFETFVGGHLTRLGTSQDVEVQKEFVIDLIRAASRANAAVTFADAAERAGPTNDTWAFFGAYVDLINEECTEEMLSEWTGKLGGAEAFMLSHCWTMTEALRVEPSALAMSQAIEEQ